MSERRVCGVLGQPRATQRYRATETDDEVGLTAAIISYATQYGRYGYRRILALLRSDGWMVNHKRMERIWRQEGLKVPQKPKPQKLLREKAVGMKFVIRKRIILITAI